MESLNAGTTTVLDYAHMNWTPRHGPQAMAGVLSSGIRSVFAYAPSMTLKKESLPAVEFEDLLPEWFMPSLEKLSKAAHQEKSRLRLGLGFDFFFLPKDIVQAVFARARSIGVHLVTSHWSRLRGNRDQGLPGLLKSYGLQDHRIVISHANGATAEDITTLNEVDGWSISASPTAEITLGFGPPVCFREVPR